METKQDIAESPCSECIHAGVCDREHPVCPILRGSPLCWKAAYDFDSSRYMTALYPPQPPAPEAGGQEKIDAKRYGDEAMFHTLADTLALAMERQGLTANDVYAAVRIAIRLARLPSPPPPAEQQATCSDCKRACAKWMTICDGCWNAQYKGVSPEFDARREAERAKQQPAPADQGQAAPRQGNTEKPILITRIAFPESNLNLSDPARQAGQDVMSKAEINADVDRVMDCIETSRAVNASNAARNAVTRLARAARKAGELKAVVDKLPRSGDGVPIVPKMILWGRDIWSKEVMPGKVESIGVTLGVCTDRPLDRPLYSTRDAALAAASSTSETPA